MKSERITHAFDPVFNSESRILILGTMPSPKSRELGFYYSHPRNRFWPVMAKIFGEELPKTPEEKQDFCLRHKILNSADIKAIFTTGTTAAKLYKKFIEPEVKIPAAALPSTSPANAKVKFEELCEEYKIILEYLQ